LAQAKAQVAAAQANLLKVMRGATPEELEQLRSAYAAAVARSKFARVAQQRREKLSEQGAIPQEEVDRIGAEREASQAEAQGAEAELRQLTNGARSEEKLVATANLELARATEQAAEAALDRRKLVAPHAGTILQSQFRVGEFFSLNGAPLFLLGDLTRLQVRLEVDEIDSLEVSLGAPCSINSDSGAVLGDGRVVHLAPRMGRRALRIESPLAKEDVRIREVLVDVAATPRLIPGQRVWGRIKRQTQEAGAPGASVCCQESSPVVAASPGPPPDSK
jgi:HlyD family secretion protein